MSDYSQNDPAMLDHSINSALVGDLPSFGAAKESKLQLLMHQNVQPKSQGFDEFDTSLSVEAKAFQPNIGNSMSGHRPYMADTTGAFNNLNLGNNGDMGMNRTVGDGNPPRSAVNEFIPRNMSAPSLNTNQQNGNFNIPEFIPNRTLNRGIPSQQQQGAMMTSMSQSNPPLLQPSSNNGNFTDVTSSRMPPQFTNTSRTPMTDFMPGNPMSSIGRPMHDSSLPGSSVFQTPPQQNSSTSYYSGDTNTPFAVGHGRSKTQSKDLKASFRFIEEYVQKFLNRKAAKDIALKGFPTPGTSSPFSQRSMNPLRTPIEPKNTGAPERTSPLLARRMTGQHRSSPLGQVSSGMNININASQPDSSLAQQPMAQETGGTTYFFTQKDGQQTMPAIVMPSFNIFPGSPPSIEYMSIKANAPSFFMPNEVRKALIQKHTLTMLTVDTEQDPSVPAEVDNYHSLFPLEPGQGNNLQKSSTFRFVTSCYKAIKYKDGLSYCLRRVHGFRQVNEKCMTLVEMWKKLQHANVVQLREVFTSKAFGEHSLIFAHDYHPGAETLMSRHFQNPGNSYASKAKWNGGTARPNAGLLQESLIWTYVVQLTSALRCIHAAGLACRVMDPTKIIITDKSRVRINGVGIFDVLGYDNSNANPRAHMQQYQQDDMVALGKVVLALACNSVTSIQRDNLKKSIELVVMNYSADLKNLVLYLLSPQQRPRNVNDIMPMIGARFFTQLDAATIRGDVIENELAKEVENGRLFRMLSKLGVINERPEFSMESAWSETGDRYLLKLFRDHLFHQVTDTGAPWIDLPHIVQCLNKLDAGVPEKLCLMSRDEQNVLVVSYAELKKAFTKCFNELTRQSSGL